MLLSRLATGPQYNVLAHQALLTLTTRPYDRKINFIPLTGRSGRRTLRVFRVYDYDPVYNARRAVVKCHETFVTLVGDFLCAAHSFLV